MKGENQLKFLFVVLQASGLKGLHKTFWGTAKESENKNLSWFIF